jgi:hypothetical protein
MKYVRPVDATTFDKVERNVVLIVDFGPDYWLIQNSYGDKWENVGYVKFIEQGFTIGLS